MSVLQLEVVDQVVDEPSVIIRESASSIAGQALYSAHLDVNTVKFDRPPTRSLPRSLPGSIQICRRKDIS
jgi:hypothetical protein